MQMITRSEPWDAIVIGSGANGGVAAQKLTCAGLQVLVLEAGRPVQGRADYGTPVSNAARQLYRHMISRRQAVQELHATYWTTHPDFFVDDVDNPYTTPPDKPFRWIRGRNFGGRTHMWDGVTPRMSDCEFKAASRDGIGPDWPIGHDELAPYYAEFERLLGVHGSRDGLRQLPDGDYRAPRAMTPAEIVFKQRVESSFDQRKVLISRGIAAGRRPDATERYSRLSSPATTFRVAVKTGRLTLRTNAVVSRILTDGARATGVEFIDAKTRATEEVRGKLVFLCASTIESIRILMHSESPEHPQGIGASSGVLGHFLMDHVAGSIHFYLPDVRDGGERYDLLGSDSILVPRYQNLGSRREDYPRGFGLWGGIQRIAVPSFLRKKLGVACGFLCARAEVLPHFDNRVELDKEMRDAWGIPVAHIVCEWKEPDLVTARAARRGAEEMIEAAGGKVVPLTDLIHTPIAGAFLRSRQEEWAQSTPGLFVHELGGARMGKNPEDSVVDPYGSCWEVPNLFVTDGACWPSGGWQNPTLTEMAITARACDHAVAEMKRSNL